MTPKTLFEMSKNLGVEDYNLCLSKYAVIDKKEEISGILDIPIFGIAHNHKDKEIRLAIEGDDLKSVIHLIGDKVVMRLNDAKKKKPKKKKT